MVRDPSYEHPQPFDPLGALIYYICVTRSIESGGLVLPSSQSISDELALRVDDQGRTRSANDRVQVSWEDLVWMNQERLLFNEQQYSPSEFFRTLSQHNVNQRIWHFPGVEQTGQRRRRLQPSHAVEKTGTAARLTALKDLYRFNVRELPQKYLRDFLIDRQLVTNPDEVYSFLDSMYFLEFIDIFPTAEWTPT